MGTPDRVKPNIRILVFIVSLPFWVLLGAETANVWLDGSYNFDFSHILFVGMVYAFIRIVVLGKHPFDINRGSNRQPTQHPD